MDPQEGLRKIRRIVVALDASRHSLAGLKAAVDLARKLDAELTGLFIEDINLLRLSQMPISNQVGRYSVTRHPVNQDEIRRQLLTQSRWAYEAIEMLSTQRNLRWSFRVARGAILPELSRAAEEADLVILGKAGWSETNLIGSTTQGVLAEPQQLTLILREGVRLGHSTMVLFDGNSAAWRALEISSQFSSSEEGKLVIMLVAESREVADTLEAQVNDWNQPFGFEILFLWTPDAHPLILCSIARTEATGLLIVPQANQLLSDKTLVEVLNEIDCPVLFVGPTA